MMTRDQELRAAVDELEQTITQLGLLLRCFRRLQESYRQDEQELAGKEKT